LEQDGFGVSESFFDLGGHSLLATRLITDMNEQLGNSWMLRDLFEHPTIEGLSSLTSTSQRQQIPLVFAAQKAGDKTPFFLASGVYDVGYHVGDGETAWERDFYRYFSTIIGIVGKDRPIYALRPRGIFKGERFRPSVEAMAKEYIDEIKLVQNKGPYIIGGECLGGNIAYEIAQRLLARGDKVKLILLDTDRGGTWSETKYRIGESIRGQKRGIWDLARSLRRSANRSERAMAELAKMRKILVPVSSADREFRRFEEGSLTLARRLTRYRPKRYPGEVSLFINEGWNRARPNLGWDSLICPNLTIRVVPGDHSTRLSVHGEVFARMLQDRLDG